MAEAKGKNSEEIIAKLNAEILKNSKERLQLGRDNEKLKKQLKDNNINERPSVTETYSAGEKTYGFKEGIVKFDLSLEKLNEIFGAEEKPEGLMLQPTIVNAKVAIKNETMMNALIELGVGFVVEIK